MASTGAIAAAFAAGCGQADQPDPNQTGLAAAVSSTVGEASTTATSPPRLTRALIVRASTPPLLYALVRYKGFKAIDGVQPYATFGNPTVSVLGRRQQLVPLGNSSSGCFYETLDDRRRVLRIRSQQRVLVRASFDATPGRGRRRTPTRVLATNAPYGAIAERHLGFETKPRQVEIDGRQCRKVRNRP